MTSRPLICFNCHKETRLLEPIGRRDECAQCSSDAHVCKNCEFYDIKVYNECREPTAERVVWKERSNFCDQFRFHSGNSGADAAKSGALNAANALFKKK